MPYKRKPMANQAYDMLFGKIVRCEYMPGQELNEKYLMDETGFGRTPLREALLLLQEAGLVDIFPRKGMRISLLTEKSVNNLYQARKLIEPTVVVQYAPYYSKSKLLSFQEMFNQSNESSDLDRFNLDRDFHSYLINITDNDILIDMYSSLLVTQVRLAMYATIQNGLDSRAADLSQHTDIVNALLRENENDIRDAIILHLNHSEVRSLNAIKLAQKSDTSV